ncbi:MAG: hypothetical protein ACI3Z9_08255 [Candidatus Onthomorpha sp.]
MKKIKRRFILLKGRFGIITRRSIMPNRPFIFAKTGLSEKKFGLIIELSSQDNGIILA